ncbi:MAG: transglutaminase domain-containing protein [Saprospiraceae bacterium]|nr:transglutaminase domain-containing protein [Saprospiraceae bacterium]
MQVRYILPFLCFVMIAVQLSAQNIPIIAATSDLVNVRDGKDFYENSWTIMPEYNPDVYESDKLGDWVVFYTDKDSIGFKIHPDSIYDFIILLNGKDSAYTRIQYAPSYLDILKQAEAYNFEDHTAIPPFTYQDSSATELQMLRKAFNLDSIAGGGNEISRILNLLHWVHNIIPHDGNHENPVVKNAMSMIAECKKDERGLNCRGLATVLNECYLALGIRSRFVTCMPKDSVFNDCHVINMVYSNDLDKWIWIDPTNDAYIMDEKGTLLGLDEVRERLIKGEMLIVNPDANWNHKASVVKENYLFEYMAKNLYRFSCPLRSEYDYETLFKGKTRQYVELIPLDGYNQLPKISNKTYETSGTSVTTYKTNNPNQFWVKPE